jgi:pyruvate/2-oxoglutarate dehydrogenase complex dihydrolipoamide acyltransferase (E2) component
MADTSPGQESALREERVDRLERIPFGDRWVPDAFELFHVPAGFGLVLTDMTQAKRALRILRDAKIPATYAHLIVRAVALAYLRDPDGVKLIYNYQRLTPAHFDVGLSMAGQTQYAPVVVVRAVDQKPLRVLVPAIIEEVDAAAAREAGDLAVMRKWTIPFRWLRRFLLGILHRSLQWRTRIVGHFQVSWLNNVDVMVPFLFYSNGILGVGSIRDRVMAVDGQPVVRPTVWLSGVSDHGAVDGRTGADVLTLIKDILESDVLVREALEAAAQEAQVREGGNVQNSAGAVVAG